MTGCSAARFPQVPRRARQAGQPVGWLHRGPRRRLPARHARQGTCAQGGRRRPRGAHIQVGTHRAGGTRDVCAGVFVCPAHTGSVPQWGLIRVWVRFVAAFRLGVAGARAPPHTRLDHLALSSSVVLTWCDPCCRPAPRSPRAKPSGSRVQSLSELKVGQVVAGRVRRAEKFGVFVEVRARGRGRRGTRQTGGCGQLCR